MGQLDELEKTFLEEYDSAMILLRHNKSKSVIILLSKALFAIADYLIYKKYNILPNNHATRFRILKIKERKVYDKVDSVWSCYIDSYLKPSREDSIRLFKKTIKEIIENDKNFSKKIKEFVKI